MSLESPESKKGISETEWQNLKQEALYWREMVRKTRKEKGEVSRSYDHILNNLCVPLWTPIEATPEERKDERYDDYVKDVDYIKRYFKLLEDFPEFAEKELKPGGGYFPEMMGQLAGVKTFVDAYETKLRGTQNSD